MLRKIAVGQGQICYEIQRKRVKNMNLRVREDGSVYVSVPYHVSFSQADKFVENNSGFVFRAIERAVKNRQISTPDHTFYLGKRVEIDTAISNKTGGELHGERLLLQVREDSIEERRAALDKWRREQCGIIFPHALQAAYDRFCRAGLKVCFPAVSVRTMKSRWGNCTAGKGKITLNSLLTEKPYQCIEYVAVHELAHFLVHNHSSDFYRVMDTVMPEHREIKKVLQGKQ